MKFTDDMKLYKGLKVESNSGFLKIVEINDISVTYFFEGWNFRDASYSDLHSFCVGKEILDKWPDLINRMRSY